MMATYGITKYGFPRKYGPSGMSAAVDAQRAIVGGQAPWMGAFTIPWRNACADVWTVNPATWANVSLLPLVGVGSRRDATLANGRYQQETLTLVLNDPTAYLPGGAYASLVALSALLRVVWTVESPGGTLTVQSGVYSVQSSPSSDDDVLGGSPLTLTAVDWLSVFLRTEAFASGYGLGQTLQAIVDAALADGCPSIGADDTFATLIAALIFGQGSQGLNIDPSWTPTRTTWFSGADPLSLSLVPFLLTQPGTPATWGDVLDYFWNYEPFRLTYDAAGIPTLRPGLVRRDSGLVLSRDPAVGGVLAVPWETLQRTVRDPSFTAVDYQVVPNTPPAEGGSGESTSLVWGGLAYSQSSVNPHREGITRTQKIRDRTPGASTGAFTDLNAYARYLLDVELGQSDVLAISLDSAFPIAELGDELRVCDPEKAINDWRQMVQLSQPLDVGPSTLTCHWREDVS
jgi:hypothetical protein